HRRLRSGRDPDRPGSPRGVQAHGRRAAGADVRAGLARGALLNIRARAASGHAAAAPPSSVMKSRRNTIEAVGLESMIEQIEILDGLPRETERDLLIAVLRRADRSEDFLETQIARYAEGDIGGLLAWLQSAEPIRGVARAQIPPPIGDRLITLRNHRMRDRALAFLRRGGAFIAVGGGPFSPQQSPLASF